MTEDRTDMGVGEETRLICISASRQMYVTEGLAMDEGWSLRLYSFA